MLKSAGFDMEFCDHNAATIPSHAAPVAISLENEVTKSVLPEAGFSADLIPDKGQGRHEHADGAMDGDADPDGSDFETPEPDPSGFEEQPALDQGDIDESSISLPLDEGDSSAATAQLETTTLLKPGRGGRSNDGELHSRPEGKPVSDFRGIASKKRKLDVDEVAESKPASHGKAVSPPVRELGRGPTRAHVHNQHRAGDDEKHGLGQRRVLTKVGGLLGKDAKDLVAKASSKIQRSVAAAIEPAAGVGLLGPDRQKTDSHSSHDSVTLAGSAEMPQLPGNELAAEGEDTTTLSPHGELRGEGEVPTPPPAPASDGTGATASASAMVQVAASTAASVVVADNETSVNAQPSSPGSVAVSVLPATASSSGPAPGGESTDGRGAAVTVQQRPNTSTVVSITADAGAVAVKVTLTPVASQGDSARANQNTRYESGFNSQSGNRGAASVQRNTVATANQVQFRARTSTRVNNTGAVLLNVAAENHITPERASAQEATAPDAQGQHQTTAGAAEGASSAHVNPQENAISAVETEPLLSDESASEVGLPDEAKVEPPNADSADPSESPVLDASAAALASLSHAAADAVMAAYSWEFSAAATLVNAGDLAALDQAVNELLDDLHEAHEQFGSLLSEGASPAAATLAGVAIAGLIEYRRRKRPPRPQQDDWIWMFSDLLGAPPGTEP